MATAKITLSASRDYPFNKLVLSQSDVRQVKAGHSIEELAEDIARRSLLQSLNVRPVMDANSQETGMFEVPAGGRYRALELLVKQKRMNKTQPVPCVVRTEGLAEEDSLAENVHRADLHPLDQFCAFQTLRDKGLSEEDIGARFFLSPSVIKQRLKLAAVSQKLLDVYAEDGMTLEQLMAVTVSNEHARQEQVWEALAHRYNKEPYHIRRQLIEGAVRAADKRAQFVGVDFYEAAGGVVLRDLFEHDDGGWLQDPALLDRLVMEKLKAEAETLRAEGWKWIAVAVEFPYGHSAGLRRLDGRRVDLTDEERVTRETLRAELDRLEAEYADANELPHDVDQRLDEIETALIAFEERPVIYDPADVARGGAFLSIDNEGKLRADRGYVNPKDEPPARATETDGHDPAAAEPGTTAATEPSAVELTYATIDWAPQPIDRITDVLYEEYALQSIRIPGAQPHPTQLVQSAAMASVAPPKPCYRPHLPPTVITGGLLSDAQLESVIYAGEAHAGYLTGAWTVDETFDVVSAAADDAYDAVRFRRGWFLGDGTGAGKGRQVAGILLDNWLKGRPRAVWISKSDKLVDDAQRDWSALGQERLLITPLSRFRPGSPIRLEQGILFTTYATLRSDGCEEQLSRVQQIVDWLGRDFDGVIVFDESHAMQNAAGEKSERGERAPSLQGRAGLRLQHALPNARVLYVSTTGPTTAHNLAYAQRLGLWGQADFPVATRAEFVEAVEAGGVAAMEALARDLKALGLYAARSLSFAGIEYELLEHQLTDEQVRIYDAYAAAFQVIHNNLNAALQAANVTGETGTLNRQAKSAARSAFESAKQRFFNHLITAMKTPTLIAAAERDLALGHAAVVQIVSTGEALMERRLAEIPTEEWADVQVDITPREYVLDYLAHGFPTQLYEPFTDGEGNLSSRPVFRDGQPVQCREAIERRDRMIERLAALHPVQGVLDQIVQRFGTDNVAEITGRSRRIVRKTGAGGVDRFVVEARAGSANLSEAQAFMDDDKRILVFSDAGSTGRSYHADLSARNQRLRVHYLLEAGWKADTAIQGLGRSNRTNQAQPPLFRPIATDVKAEKRFLSTIARRLDTLGAITKGQRQTGGQGLFRADDNLESVYARAALRQLYLLIFTGKVEGCSLQMFEDATGLRLTDNDGSLREDLPPITTFLNRLLALTIDLQNTLFGVFDDLLRAKVEGAIASGTYDIGVETIIAESLVVTDRRTLYAHPQSGAETSIFTIKRRDRNRPFTLGEALERARDRQAKLLVNDQSKRAAVQVPAPSLMRDDGTVERRVRLLRPMERPAIPLDDLAHSHWREADRAQFEQVWEAEIAAVPPFSDSILHVVTGLLLSIWKRLPDDSMRVYRLQTDNGERIIGRLVSPAWVAEAVETDAPTLAPADAFAAVLDGRTVLQLQDGLELRRVKLMGEFRIELSGFSDGMVERLKAIGLISEIISWKLRLFVLTGTTGPAILEKLMERHPLIRLADKTAA